MITRRGFLAGICACSTRLAIAAEIVAGRKLDFMIGDDFGDARPADIRAALTSTAETIWDHCPNTVWQVPGFFVMRAQHDFPMIHNEHRQDGRVVIELNTSGRSWSQYAFQFAHEFCHALAGHTNDWRQLHIRGRNANLWLEESLCETASLFALREMEVRWTAKAPYPNWRSYAPSLKAYAQKRLDSAAAEEKGFSAWFAVEEKSLRATGVERNKNVVVATRLLPLFEAEPGGWEAVTFCNAAKRDPEATLADYFSAWLRASPLSLRPFVKKVAAVFDQEPA